MTRAQLLERRRELERELHDVDALIDATECPGEGVCDASVCHTHLCLICGVGKRESGSYVCAVCDPPSAAEGAEP